MRPRRLWLGLGLAVMVAGTAAGFAALRAYEARRLRAEVEQAKAHLVAGRNASALRILRDLAGRWPGHGEVEYYLGLCQQVRGRPDAALTAWGRVRLDDAPFGGWAAIQIADLELRRGRVTAAEDGLRAAIATPGSHRKAARWDLVHLLRLQGRSAEARTLFLEGFDEQPDPVSGLRKLYHLDVDPFPAEGIRRVLREAARHFPEDDRAWLGLANLATREGRLDEAGARLDACLARRPDDPAVWRARLDWAVAAERPDLARVALGRVPCGRDLGADAEAEALRLRAWFAARAGDAGAERSALERLAAADPGETVALERLSELEAASGRDDRALGYRRRKAEVSAAREAYVAGLESPDPRARASELAGHAARLGRRFDAACWSALARHPDRSSADLVATAQHLSGRPSPGPRTFADLLPDLVSATRAAARPAPGPVRAPAAPRFRDDAEAVGLRFLHDNGHTPGRLTPPESFGGGVGLLDYDGDGWLDVYAVQSGPFPPDPGTSAQGDRLFRNRGDGTFEDVTAPSGLAGMAGGYGFGVAVGDVDNDGRPDLFVTRWRSYALYRNRGDGTFEDVTAGMGLGGDRDWPTSAAFADLDGDGDLDLYVCHYLRWEESARRPCVDPDDPTRYRCNPRDFPALPDRLYRNEGGRFVDATAEAGIDDRDGRGLGVLAADLDEDGRIDLFVANDMTANALYRNLGGFRFEETAVASGVASNAGGGFQAGMGVACGDVDGDGRPELAVTNFYNESTTLFRNLGAGRFADHTAASGLAGPSRFLLGFGIALPDVDNDGRLDLMTVNGHVFDGRPRFPWTMPTQLLLGGEDGRLHEVGSRAGPPWSVLRMGRGLAVGDLDNDGRVDAVVLAQNEPLAYFHNRSEIGRAITLELEGRASGRDAVGARVRVTAGGRDRVVLRIGGGSYQSACDPRLHIGLGAAARAEAIEVRWPSGRIDRHAGLAADSGYRLVEGDPEPHPLAGWPGSWKRTTNGPANLSSGSSHRSLAE